MAVNSSQWGLIQPNSPTWNMIRLLCNNTTNVSDLNGRTRQGWFCYNLPQTQHFIILSDLMSFMLWPCVMFGCLFVVSSCPALNLPLPLLILPSRHHLFHLCLVILLFQIYAAHTVNPCVFPSMPVSLLWLSRPCFCFHLCCFRLHSLTLEQWPSPPSARCIFSSSAAETNLI